MVTATQSKDYNDGQGTYVRSTFYGIEMQFVITEEQACEILSIWRNKEWQSMRNVKVFRSSYNDHGYHKCFNYALKDAEGKRTAGMDNYRREYATVFHWVHNDIVNQPPTHKYAVLFWGNYGEMLKGQISCQPDHCGMVR